MPLKPPVFDPPFNILRSSHVELGVATSPPRAPSTWIVSACWSPTRPGTRSICAAVEERNHHSIVLRQSGQALCYALGYKVGDEDDLDRPPNGSRRKGLPTAFPRGAASGPHAVRTATCAACRSSSMPAWSSGRAHAAEIRLASRRAHPAHRSPQLLHADDVQSSYEFYNDLGFRLTEYTETDDKPTAVLGGVDAAQGQRPRHRLHQRRRPAPASHRRVDRSGARHPPYLRRDGDDRLSANMERGPGRHGISNAFFLYMRDPGRPPGRAVHQRLSHRRSTTTSRSAGRCATRSARRCGAIRRRSPGSRRAPCSTAARCARRCSRRSRSWRAECYGI